MPILKPVGGVQTNERKEAMPVINAHHHRKNGSNNQQRNEPKAFLTYSSSLCANGQALDPHRGASPPRSASKGPGYVLTS